MAHEKTKIVPFPFHGAVLDVARMPDGDVGLNLRRLCENVGVAYSAQLQKLKAAPWATVSIIDTVGGDGKSRPMTFLHRRCVPMWAATISPNKVKLSVRPLVVALSIEATDVLADHFLGKRGAPTAGLSDAALELQQQAMLVRDHPTYRASLHLALRAVASASGLSFQAVHGQLRRRFRVPSYQYLVTARVDDALALLEDFASGRLRLASAPLRKTLPGSDRQLVLFRGGA
jgi:hypothetical protein